MTQVNNPICYSPLNQFCQIYKEIISETYNIFPIPKKFIESILRFIITAKPLEEKLYSCTNIINKYTKNWKYYSVFKFNFQRMLQKSFTASIKVIKFKTKTELINILNKYKPLELQFEIDITTKAAIYAYTQAFDLILLVNDINQNKFEYYKAIQHELIHWMQVVLNAESCTDLY